jgi:hypothetical protein
MVHRFWPDCFIAFLVKEKGFHNQVCHFLEMSNFEQRILIKFFTHKRLNATKINKELDNVYKDCIPSYRTIAYWMAVSREPDRGFKDAP